MNSGPPWRASCRRPTPSRRGGGPSSLRWQRITAAAATDGERWRWEHLSDPQRFSCDAGPGSGLPDTGAVPTTAAQILRALRFRDGGDNDSGDPFQVRWLPSGEHGDTWVVRAHDMHAWPELFFGDLGWVRFNPQATPPLPDWRTTTHLAPLPDAVRTATRRGSQTSTTDSRSPPDPLMLGRALRAPVLLLALLLALISPLVCEPGGHRRMQCWRHSRSKRPAPPTRPNSRHRLDLHLDWPQGSVQVQEMWNGR